MQQQRQGYSYLTPPLHTEISHRASWPSEYSIFSLSEYSFPITNSSAERIGTQSGVQTLGCSQKCPGGSLRNVLQCRAAVHPIGKHRIISCFWHSCLSDLISLRSCPFPFHFTRRFAFRHPRRGLNYPLLAVTFPIICFPEREDETKSRDRKTSSTRRGVIYPPAMRPTKSLMLMPLFSLLRSRLLDHLRPSRVPASPIPHRSPSPRSSHFFKKPVPAQTDMLSTSCFNRLLHRPSPSLGDCRPNPSQKQVNVHVRMHIILLDILTCLPLGGSKSISLIYPCFPLELLAIQIASLANSISPFYPSPHITRHDVSLFRS